jgi:hypothetical protein
MMWKQLFAVGPLARPKPSKPDFADGKSLSSKNSASVGTGISKRSETVAQVFPPSRAVRRQRKC